VVRPRRGPTTVALEAELEALGPPASTSSLAAATVSLARLIDGGAATAADRREFRLHRQALLETAPAVGGDELSEWRERVRRGPATTG
jgi:hypothetical protein